MLFQSGHSTFILPLPVIAGVLVIASCERYYAVSDDDSACIFKGLNMNTD